MKPFYIYTKKASLYIKNINDDPLKISSNIYTYTVNIDTNDKINIFCIDNFGRVLYIKKVNEKWEKRVIGKFFSILNNIEDIVSFCIDDYFNLFISEKTISGKDIYKISHINFSKLKSIKPIKTNFNNIRKINQAMYNIEIKGKNIVIEYKLRQKDKTIIDKKSTFNHKIRTWNI